MRSLKAFEGRGVHVIMMIVTDQDGIDRRQVPKSQSGRPDAFERSDHPLCASLGFSICGGAVTTQSVKVLRLNLQLRGLCADGTGTRTTSKEQQWEQLHIKVELGLYFGPGTARAELRYQSFPKRI